MQKIIWWVENIFFSLSSFKTYLNISATKKVWQKTQIYCFAIWFWIKRWVQKVGPFWHPSRGCFWVGRKLQQEDQEGLNIKERRQKPERVPSRDERDALKSSSSTIFHKGDRSFKAFLTVVQISAGGHMISL